MTNFFYFDQNGQKQGPVNDQQLKALATQGVINPQTPLETDTGHRGQAGQIPDLFAAPALELPPVTSAPDKPLLIKNPQARLAVTCILGVACFLMTAWIGSSIVSFVTKPNATKPNRQTQMRVQETQERYQRELAEIENELMRKPEYNAEVKKSRAKTRQFWDVLPDAQKRDMEESWRKAEESNRKHVRAQAELILLERNSK